MQRIFELFAKGNISVAELRKQTRQETGRIYAKGYLHKTQQRLTAIRTRVDHAYLDKLDGKITAEFWERKNAEWLQDEQQVQFALAEMKQADKSARLLTASRTLELANKAYSLYVRQNPAEQAKLLKMVLSNCTINAVSITPTYRKPFDLIFTRAKMKNGAP